MASSRPSASKKRKASTSTEAADTQTIAYTSSTCSTSEPTQPDGTTQIEPVADALISAPVVDASSTQPRHYCHTGSSYNGFKLLDGETCADAAKRLHFYPEVPVREALEHMQRRLLGVSDGLWSRDYEVSTDSQLQDIFYFMYSHAKELGLRTYPPLSPPSTDSAPKQTYINPHYGVSVDRVLDIARSRYRSSFGRRLSEIVGAKDAPLDLVVACGMFIQAHRCAIPPQNKTGYEDFLVLDLFSNMFRMAHAFLSNDLGDLRELNKNTYMKISLKAFHRMSVQLCSYDTRWVV